MALTPDPAAAEDLVRLTASIQEYPNIEQIDELLQLISTQPANFARATIVNGLLDMKAILLHSEKVHEVSDEVLANFLAS